MPSGQSCLQKQAQLKVKALISSKPLGYAEITHPFHPLRGQKFPILKTKIVSGCQTLILQGTVRGSFAVLEEWTDQNNNFTPDTHQQNSLVLDFQCLVELNDLLKKLEKQNK